MFFPHAGLPTPEWHIFKKLYYSSNSYYIFAERDRDGSHHEFIHIKATYKGTLHP